MADNGALLGAWSVWMGAPDLGTAFAALQATIGAFQALPPRVQQVITLLTAARQRAAYELAGHRIIALTHEFTASEADALTAGYAPSTLSPAEQLAASATQCLLAGGALPQNGLRGSVAHVRAARPSASLFRSGPVPVPRRHPEHIRCARIAPSERSFDEKLR